MGSIFLLILLSLSVQTAAVQVSAASTNFLGISGLSTDTSAIDNVISIMKARGLNIYRMSCYASWLSDRLTRYDSSYVRYFLDHTPSNYMIIVDINHLYPSTEASAASARSHWTTIKNNIFQVLRDYRNNRRVAVELINEYVSSDFYTRMQSIVNEIRSAGYTNTIVVNKFSQPWAVINDPLKNTYQSYHYYFNGWSPSGAISNIKLALSKGIKLINTEVGADYRENSHFSSSTVSELNFFLVQCASLGIGNLVWMNYNGESSNNWPRYKALGLSFPTVFSPLASSSTQTSKSTSPNTQPQNNGSNNLDTGSDATSTSSLIDVNHELSDNSYLLYMWDNSQECKNAFINKINVK